MNYGLFRLFIVIFSLALPSRMKRLLLVYALGYRIDVTASIGLSLVLSEEVYLGPGSSIGHFTVVRGLKLLEVHERAKIGQWNWITASADFESAMSQGSTRSCVIGQMAAVTSRHYVDCSGGFFLGSFSILAGVRSTVISHQIDTELSQQTIGAVRIGSYCNIGSNVKITPHTVVYDRSVIAMGSVARGELSPSGFLWAGVPAVRKHAVVGEWFHRNEEPSNRPTGERNIQMQ